MKTRGKKNEKQEDTLNVKSVEKKSTKHEF